jgi:glutathione S-transferase
MKIKFTYFDGRGHGERIRYALAAAGLDYEEQFLRVRGDLDAVRDKCLFRQVPLLEIDDEEPYVQSYSIVRMLGKRFGPKSLDDYKADAFFEQLRDFVLECSLGGFGWSAKDEHLEKIKVSIANHFPMFERVLQRRGGFTTGKEKCWCDYQLLYILDYSSEILGEDILGPYPLLAALRSALRVEENIQVFYKTKAKRLVDERYIFEVRESMLPKE